MVKRKIWMVLFVMAAFLIPKKVLAANCTSAPILAGCVIVDKGNCKSNGFDCDNVETLYKTECVVKGGCYESRNCGSYTTSHFCYLPVGEDQTPEECGYIGRVCCSNDTCPNGGIPTKDDLGLKCTCTESGNTNNSSVNTNSNYNPSCTTNDGKFGTNTALGCIPIEIKDFVPWLLNILFGIAGGIAFLLMVYGFILIATSGGDEKKMAGAKETITSAIVGLLVCIFSIFILKLIAVNILRIPGF